MKVPLAIISLGQEDIDRAFRVFNSGQLTMGSLVSEFENRMCDYLDVRNFIMVNSGSSANLLIFEFLLRPSSNKPLLAKGDGVLVPAIAWPTSIWPIIQLGLTPVFVDVDPNNFSMDLDSAESAIKESQIHIKALFPIHPLGWGIDHNSLADFSAKHSLINITDACESLGSWINGSHAGCESLATSFSFYFSHHITTMEGGGIATDDNEMADDLKSMRSHGWTRDRKDASKYIEKLPLPDSKFQFLTTGYNVRPMEIQAAIGLGQIDKIDDFVLKRKRLASMVVSAISQTPLSVPNWTPDSESALRSRNSWMMIPLAVTCTPNCKEKIQEFLELQGIETRPVLTGNFLLQPVMNRLNDYESSVPLTNTNWVAEHCFLIGAHHELSQEQIDHLLTTLATVSCLC